MQRLSTINKIALKFESAHNVIRGRLFSVTLNDCRVRVCTRGTPRVHIHIPHKPYFVTVRH